MVLEKVVTYFLDKYLGDYFSNLDSHQLKIDLWNGNVTLHDLAFKTNPLNGSSLPVKIVGGHLKKLSLNIPWKHFSRSPTRIEIEGFSIVFASSDEMIIDEEEDEEKKYQLKMNELKKIEDFRKEREKKRSGGANESMSMTDSLLEHLKCHLLRNVEVILSDVHLSYEDQLTHPGKPFQFGLILHSLRLERVNEEWNSFSPTDQHDEHSSLVHKLAEVKQLSLYWNWNVQFTSEERNLAQEQSLSQLNYILPPLNIQGRLKIGKFSRRPPVDAPPLLQADLLLDKVDLQLHRKQYSDLLDFLEFQDQYQIQRRYFKYSPDKSRSTRWQWAIGVILDEEVRPRLAAFKWEKIRENLKKVRNYRELYQKQLTQHRLNREETEKIKDLEKQLDLFNLISTRRQIEIQVKKEKKIDSYWERISHWWNSTNTEEQQQGDANEEKRLFYQSIGYEEEDDNEHATPSVYPLEYRDLAVTCRLNEVHMKIWSTDKSTEITSLSLLRSQLSFSHRPAHNDLRLAMSLHALEFAGYEKDGSVQRPILIEKSSDEKGADLFSMEFESFPLDSNADYRLDLRTEPLQIIYHAETINQLVQCFLPDRHHDLQSLKAAAYSIYQDIKERTAFLLSENLKKIKDLDIQVLLQSVFFILPEHGTLTDSSSVLCLNLGQFTFTDLVHHGSQPAVIEEEEEEGEEIYEDAPTSFVDPVPYFPLQAQLTDFQLLFCTPSEDWKTEGRQKKSPSRLIEPVEFTLNIYKSKYIHTNPFLPIWKIDGELPSIESHLVDQRLLKIMAFVQSIPFPEGQVDEEEEAEKSLEQFERRRLTTKETADMVESMTPVKKLLYEEEKEKEREEEEHIDQQRTGLHFLVKLRQIDLYLEKCGSELLDHREGFAHFSLSLIVGEAKIGRYDVYLNGSIDHCFLTEDEFVEENTGRAFHLIEFPAKKAILLVNCLLTSRDNPQFSSSTYHSIENQMELQLKEMIVNCQFEPLISLVSFQRQLFGTNSKASVPKKTEEPPAPEEKTPSSMAAKVHLEGVAILFAVQSSPLLYIQLREMSGHISSNEWQTSLSLQLDDLTIDDLHEKSFEQQILSKKVSNDNRLIHLDLLLLNTSKKRANKKFFLEQRSHLKLHLEKTRFLFLYKHLDFVLNLLRLFQQPSSNNSSSPPAPPSLLVEQIPLEYSTIDLQVKLNLPEIAVPRNSFVEEHLLIDLGSIRTTGKDLHHDEGQSTFTEDNRIIWEGLSAEEKLLDCSPIELLFHREKSLNRWDITFSLQWTKLLVEFNRPVIDLIRKIQEENFKEKIFPSIPAVPSPSGVKRTSPAATEKRLKDLSDEIELTFRCEWKEIQVKVDDLLELQCQTIEMKVKQNSANRQTSGHIQIHSLLVEDQTQEKTTTTPAAPMLSLEYRSAPLNENDGSEQTTIEGLAKTLAISLSTNLLRGMKDLLLQQTDEEQSVADQPQRRSLPMESFPPPSRGRPRSINQPSFYQQILSFTQPTTPPAEPKEEEEQKEVRSPSMERTIDFRWELFQLNLIESETKNCLTFQFSPSIKSIAQDEEQKNAMVIEKLRLYAFNLQSASKQNEEPIEYQVLEETVVNIHYLQSTAERKIDCFLQSMEMHFNAQLISIVHHLLQLQETKPKKKKIDEKERIDLATVFLPKPFEQFPFAYLSNENLLAQITRKSRDDLKVESPPAPPQPNKSSEQITLRVKFLEVKLESSRGRTSKGLLALCLSDVFAQVDNWSSNLNVSASLSIELALFNDHLLSWEPLIEPVCDEQGVVLSPWNIQCQTIQNDDEEEEEVDVRRLISVRSEHLLNVTLTKSSIHFFEQLSSMFSEKKEMKFFCEEDDEQSLIKLDNATGATLIITQLNSLEFVSKDVKELKIDDGQSVHLTVPNERLSATHLPMIAEQIGKRKQQFLLKIDEREKLVDINQTSRRVYDLSPSSIVDWPIQMLCHSQIHEDHRQVLFSSIVRVTNLTASPLLILRGSSLDRGELDVVKHLNVADEYSLPIDLLYYRSTSKLYFALEGTAREEVVSFDWIHETTTERIFRSTEQTCHYLIYKESKESYLENTDEPNRQSFQIFVQLPVHLTNLLPIPIQISIDNEENVPLQPSDLHQSRIGHRKSVLQLIIENYKNARWTCPAIDLAAPASSGVHDEHQLEAIDLITGERLRLMMRIDHSRECFRLSFYSPYWIINSTQLILDFKIDHEKTYLDSADQLTLICPKNHSSESKKKKGSIRLWSVEDDESRSGWSKSFSLDVIQSTGGTHCRVHNDRTYLISMDIVTCSFGMSQVITILPALVLHNRSSIPLDVVEDLEGNEEEWISLGKETIVPFWPKDFARGRMRVRVGENVASRAFPVNEKHRTLLKLDGHSSLRALLIEVTPTDFDGFEISFLDYQLEDLPLLLINFLPEESIAFAQKNSIQTQILPPEHYVYSSWSDPWNEQKLLISSAEHSQTIELNSMCGVLAKSDEETIYYSIESNDFQRVLVFSNDQSLIQSISQNSSRLADPSADYLELSFRHLSLSIIDDFNREDLIYITINPSREIWVERDQFHLRPIERTLNRQIEEKYQKFLTKQEDQHQVDSSHWVKFIDDRWAELWNDKEEKKKRVEMKRQALDGFWVGLSRSSSVLGLHLRLNQLQVDNQLHLSTFPVLFQPILSKAANTDFPGRPLIELSVLKDQTTTRPNVLHIKYWKLLVQEFSVSLDQTLILAFLDFFKTEQNDAVPSIDMSKDLQRLSNPLDSLIGKDQDGEKNDQTKVSLEQIHLSPLKIHVSFSLHGSSKKGKEQLLVQYPLVDFLLQLFNLAEVQDVILKLNYYERKNDRVTLDQLQKEITRHYEKQFFQQLHVVVLGLDVLGNPFGVIRGVAEGVETFFYEPYQGAMEGPMEFLQGIAKGSRFLFGSVVGGAAGALAKVSSSASKGLATLTLDKDYQNIRIQRKELIPQSKPTTDLLAAGKNTGKDFVMGVKGLVKKPLQGAKRKGNTGLVKGLGKGFLGLFARPTSALADLTSQSFNYVKRVANHEEIVHRVRQPRHIGRDRLIRPSIANETFGFHLFENVRDDHSDATETYVAHILCSSSSPRSYLLASTKRLFFWTETSSSREMQWIYSYKQLRGPPKVLFDQNYLEIHLQERNSLGKKQVDQHSGHVVPYENLGDARYIVDQISWLMHLLEL